MEDTLHRLIHPGDPSRPALILLHGRGGDETSFHQLGRKIHPELTIISLRAPFPAAPWGYGPGYAWYRFLSGTTPESSSFLRGQEILHFWLGSRPITEHLGAGFILGGFSQGATSALAYALLHPGTVRGVAVLSGFLADHPSLQVTSENPGATPIFWGHGSADLAIPWTYALAGQQVLKENMANLTSHAYHGQGHAISPEELADLRAWLDRTTASAG